ncbi:unnamed protein product [Musa acuminata subsp. malaccensis]|uniref:(wild Malaysian banana) hypothetical protein n=1 Tax=Musa acuminata subsp. malaccensis TaxID=214687 RepID=A0A804KFV6_MUSAM|nr:PREDICTED: pentatricopeptide repeat-containing protein At1g62350-like [Musa acuminata subsp. malaccensis]XP_009416282.1 PREDICTED: pentatricopeptide repeat-containing protein At1g62350-like [Musa acuminata subsp. malaccensis]CAG1834170.1 unnamed protein product [Musa acuminata subsp. malaccensis]
MASLSLSTTRLLFLRRSPPPPQQQQLPCPSHGLAAPVTCGPRDNRGKLLRGRTLSTEAILAVQALKRAAAAGDEARVHRIISVDLGRLIKADLLAALAELQRQNEWGLSSKAFAAARREPWYRTDLALYAEMVSSLARCGASDEIDALVACLLEDEEGWISSENTKEISRFVRALMAAEKAKLVRDVYGNLKSGGFEPDEFLFKFLIRGLRRLGEDAAAEEVERDFEVWYECGSLPLEPLPV